MSHHFIVPTNENGLSLDSAIGDDIAMAMGQPLSFRTCFVYSHGWWTNAIRAMEGYNRFTIDFSAALRSSAALANLQTLNIGIHWPSTLSEDSFSLLNYAQAPSFFTMKKRADTVGENCGNALLKFILAQSTQGGDPIKLKLAGHSFGCNLICNALQQLAIELAINPIPQGVTIDVALLEPAFDNDELEAAANKDYNKVATLPNIRLLITRSDLDSALGSLYPKAHKLAHLFLGTHEALGFTGPTDAEADRFGGKVSVSVGPGFAPTPAAMPRDKLLVADLTALHEEHPENNEPLSGHHSDIFYKEIYALLGGFFF